MEYLLIITCFLGPFVYFRVRERIEHKTDNDRFFEYLVDYLTNNPKLERLTVIAQHIIRHEGEVSEEAKYNYVKAVEDFSEDVIVDYYKKTGDDFFEQLTESIQYFNKPDELTNSKMLLLVRIQKMLKDTKIKQEMDYLSNSISDENDQL